jgi:hypothetical protein
VEERAEEGEGEGEEEADQRATIAQKMKNVAIPCRAGQTGRRDLDLWSKTALMLEEGRT